MNTKLAAILIAVFSFLVIIFVFTKFKQGKLTTRLLLMWSFLWFVVWKLFGLFGL